MQYRSRNLSPAGALALAAALSLGLTGCHAELIGPAPGSTTASGSSSGGSAAPILVTSVTLAGDQLNVNGRGLSHVSSATLTGAGISSPSLTIAAQSDGSLVLSAGAQLQLALGTAYNLLLSSADADTPVSVTFQVQNGSIGPAQLDRAYVPVAGGTMLGPLALPANGFSVGSTQLVLSGGNVGIGTTNPGTLFTVQGTDNTDVIRLVSANGTETFGWGYNNKGSSTNGVTLYGSVAGGELATVWNDGEMAIGRSYAVNQDSGGTNGDGLIVQGNVGIGTTTPKFALDVEAGTNETFAQLGNNFPVYTFDPLFVDYTGIGFNLYRNNHMFTYGQGSTSDYGGAITYIAYTGEMDFWTTSSPGAAGGAVGLYPAMTLLANGNFGIANASPVVALDVNGVARLASNSAQPFSCDTGHAGSIAMTSVYALCTCDGTSWYFSDTIHNGAIVCSW